MFFERENLKKMEFFCRHFDKKESGWIGYENIIASGVRDSFVEYWPKICARVFHFASFYNQPIPDSYKDIALTHKIGYHDKSIGRDETQDYKKIEIVEFVLGKLSKAEKIKEILDEE